MILYVALFLKNGAGARKGGYVAVGEDLEAVRFACCEHNDNKPLEWYKDDEELVLDNEEIERARGKKGTYYVCGFLSQPIAHGSLQDNESYQNVMQ